MRSTINVAGSDPIDLATFKEFIKWDSVDTSEDDVMEVCLLASTEKAEDYTGRAIRRSTWNGYLDSWSNTEFDVHPVDLTLVSVSYYNASNVLTVLPTTEYELIDNGADQYARIEFTGTMPELYDRNEPIVVAYTAGLASVPYRIQLGILKDAATDFEQRTNHVVGTGISYVVNSSHTDWFRYKMF